jgi:hypothetical protein
MARVLRGFWFSSEGGEYGSSNGSSSSSSSSDGGDMNLSLFFLPFFGFLGSWFRRLQALFFIASLGVWTKWNIFI